jgi:SAM-dependent methyltransferase
VRFIKAKIALVWPRQIPAWKASILKMQPGGNKTAINTATGDSSRVALRLLETLEPEFRPDYPDFEREFSRYRFVLSHLLPQIPPGGAVLDLGAGPAAVSLGLRLSGANVTVADKWELYGDPEPPAADAPRVRSGLRWNMMDRFARHGVNVRDLDLLQNKLPFPDATFDMVLLLAVIEHLSASPRQMLEEVRRILKPGGVLALEVPNIAALRNRLRLLIGRSVHFPLTEWYYANPYVGHYREMTCAEVREYVHYLRMDLISLQTSNASFRNTKHADGFYSRPYRLNSLFQWAKSAYLLACAPFPQLRFEILALARKP